MSPLDATIGLVSLLVVIKSNQTSPNQTSLDVVIIRSDYEVISTSNMHLDFVSERPTLNQTS